MLRHGNLIEAGREGSNFFFWLVNIWDRKMFYSYLWKFRASVYSLPFSSNHCCNTRTFVTLNSFSEKVLNWLDLKTSPFSLWFVLEKIAFKGFEGKKRGLRGKKRSTDFSLLYFGAWKKGTWWSGKVYKIHNNHFYFVFIQDQKGFRAWTNICNSNRTKKSFCLISCTMNDIL